MVLNKLIANLPQTVRLVTRTPRLSTRQLVNAVNTALLKRLNTTKGVHMFRRIRNLFGAANARVCNFRRLITTNFFRPFHRFIRAGLVNLNKVPYRIRTAQPLVAEAGTVLPTVTKGRVTTEVTGHNDTRFLSRFSSILTRAIFVNFKITQLVSTIMCTTARVLRRQPRRSIISQDCFGIVVSSRSEFLRLPQFVIIQVLKRILSFGHYLRCHGAALYWVPGTVNPSS